MKKLTIVVTVFVLILVGCFKITPHYDEDDQQSAMKAATAFNDSFNSCDYHAIFAASHPKARETKSEAKLVEVLSLLKNMLGPVRTAKLVEADVDQVSATERSVRLHYQTEFEKGTRNQIFVFLLEDKDARLFTFSVATDEELKEALKTAK